MQKSNISFAFLFILFSMIVLSFSACQDKEDESPAPVLATQTVKNLAADATQPRTGKFTLYNLKENKIISNTDSASTQWDIGFNGTTLIVNGGATRVGKGGAYLHTGLFEDLSEVPTTATFKGDNAPADLAIPIGSGNGWYNYNPQSNTITPIAGRVIVLKTGEGNYAKLEILSYYKDAPANPTATDAARYYTFRYVLQSNGSTNF
ncbi:HmuY family protein [Hugenholtzia roseola]|uniref:HmuY family protein n=1 Tax=Hugenholtzia roseola TaxID=1002 RepID=UPI00041189F7|nr:HmuY family protein [Hugenholtzia roseola]